MIVSLLVLAAFPCDLASLRETAIRGRLSAEESVCLDRLIDDVQGDSRRAAARLRITDAWARGDLATWEARTAQLVIELGDEDIDLIALLAGVAEDRGDPAAAWMWSERAVTRADPADPPAVLDRVFGVRARAAHALWRGAPPGPERDRLHSSAVAAARAWVDRTEAGARDGNAARALCISLGGRNDDCRSPALR